MQMLNIWTETNANHVPVNVCFSQGSMWISLNWIKNSGGGNASNGWDFHWEITVKWYCNYNLTFMSFSNADKEYFLILYLRLTRLNSGNGNLNWNNSILWHLNFLLMNVHHSCRMTLISLFTFEEFISLCSQSNSLHASEHWSGVFEGLPTLSYALHTSLYCTTKWLETHTRKPLDCNGNPVMLPHSEAYISINVITLCCRKQVQYTSC